jgi:TPR repeat protein
MKVRSNHPPISFEALRSLDEAGWRSALSGDPVEVARWLDAAARYGLVEAQTLFGQILLDGRGLPRDPDRAFRWFRIAADARHPPAMNMAGRCLEHGWGAPRDWAGAAAWYRRAAVASFDWAQYNLANMLLRGRGVPLDRKQALAWYLRAAAQGHAKSMNLVGRFLEEGWEMPANRRGAIAWYQRAAELGDFRAQFNLASWLVQGGRKKEAVPWLLRAAESASFDFLVEMDHQLQHDDQPCLRPVRVAVSARLAAARAARAGSMPAEDRSGRPSAAGVYRHSPPSHVALPR